MKVYNAIKEMRRLSAENRPFSFSFMSCNLTDRSSEGIVTVRRAKLLKRECVAHHKHADMVEAYIDLDTMESRRFYQPLLMYFNGEKCVLQ